MPMKVSDRIMIGGHVSAAGGVSNSPERASKFSFRTFQIFSKNQRQWKSKPLDPEEITNFRSEMKKHSMSKVMVHGSYLLNLGTPDRELKEKSLAAFKDEIERVEQLEIDYLTFHPGSSKDTTVENALKNIAGNINASIREGQKSTILLETTAGQGTTVGYTFEQIASIIDQVDRKDLMGVCFDTCHVWAAGYDIKSPEGYQETMDQFNSTIGLDRLLGFHLNDSKKGMGSRVDRHEQIGDGTLGIDGIANFVNDKRFREVPMILETPLGEEGYEKDLKTIARALKEE